MSRRGFCGSALLALPLTHAFGKGKEKDLFPEVSDPVMDALADAFASTTLDGVNNGFSAEHFHQYAGQVRIFDAYLEEKGTNARMNRKLGDDDWFLLNPNDLADMTQRYWKQHGILFEGNHLIRLASVDPYSYGAIKKAIKAQGGVQALHRRIAAVFEHKAEEFSHLNLHSRLTIRDGSILFPALQNTAPRHAFLHTQYEELDLNDPSTLVDVDLDCLCKAMAVEGAALSILCATVCQPCCVPSAVMLALVTLMESFGYCSSDRC